MDDATAKTENDVRDCFYHSGAFGKNIGADKIWSFWA
jgi:hypothetical protein